jgi:hypothetical protein
LQTIRYIALLLLITTSASAQTLKGKIYDSKTTLSNIQVSNLSKNTVVYSDDDGNFSIQAKITDTIVFNSLFYDEQMLFVNKEHLNQITVIELESTTNTLNEVSLTSIKQKDGATLTAETQQLLGSQFKSDRELNPHLYGPPPNPNMDLVAIAKLIGKLFKKKKKYVTEFATHDDFDQLFQNTSFFNKKMLNENLKITDDLSYLFFEYCEANNIDKALFSSDNQMQLLEELLQLSASFNLIVETSKTSNKN